jgi:hypothetical protein
MAEEPAVPARQRRNAATTKPSPREELRIQKFFISYRRSDADSVELAQYLRSKLETAGHEVFIDIGMSIGTDWVTEITRRMDWADYLIVLLSESARTSEMVQGEVRLAHRRRKRDGKPGILPIRIHYEGTLDYELDCYLGRIQYILWRGLTDSERVLSAIAERANQPPTLVPRSAVVSQLPPQPVDTRRPQPRVDPRHVTLPGGSVSPIDPFYVTRSSDSAILEAAAIDAASTLIIKGPRQMGKSSLLIRYMAAARKHGCEVSFLDFADFADSELAEYPRLLGALTEHFSQTFGTQAPAKPPLQQRDLTRYVEQQILAKKSGSLVIALDEVDRLLGRPYQRDFFTLLRSWHNKRAELNGWERVSMALVLSTEPYLLIDSDDRSPFNVSPPVTVKPFTPEACATLNEQYGAPLDGTELEELYELLSGQPYLTRLAFYRLTAAVPMSFTTLMETASDAYGPFGDHLRALLLKLNQLPDLLDGFTRLIRNATALSRDVADRLSAAGLVTSDPRSRTVPANLVYARFFKQVLK